VDITCAKCGEPWDAYHLRHDVMWWQCVEHRQSTERRESGIFYHQAKHPIYGQDVCTSAQEVQVEPADNGEIPAEVQADYDRQPPAPGWLNFVARGKGCPSCYGRPERQTRSEPLSFAELDDIDAATEGTVL
jgi:hypothetical protein